LPQQQQHNHNMHLNGLQAHQLPIGTTLNNLINSANLNNNNNILKNTDIKGSPFN
jgi:hypothetical protein